MYFDMPIISSSLTIFVVLTCLLLANWQHDRAKQKRQRLDSIQQLQTMGSIEWHELTKLPKNLNKTGLNVQLSGTLNNKQFWLLDNRVYQHQVGFDVLAMFTPKNSEDKLIVNLGWIKATQSRDELPDVKLPTHPITLQVQLKQGDLAGFYLQKQQVNNSQWPKQVQYIDLQIMQIESHINMVNFMAYSSEANFSLQPHYTPVVMPPSKHLAYALQWLLLAIAALVIFLIAVKPFKKTPLTQGESLE